MGLGEMIPANDADASSAHELRGEREEREAEQAADEHEWLTLQTMKMIPHGVSQLEDMAQRMERARSLVHEAMNAAESGYPLLRQDLLLTQALAELGCAGCGERINPREMAEVTFTRKHGVHLRGQCFEKAQKLGRV